VFIEKDFKAVSVIRENIAMLELEPRSEIQKNDAKRALDGLAERGVRFDLVFLDPPYKLLGMYEELILRMQELGMLNNRAYVVAEHGSDVSLPDQIGSAVRWRHAVYGEVSVSFYEVGESAEEAGRAEEGMTD
jgi:16S rRNA (guanine(966)-N(2))-methyltransferase RsmD